MKIIKIELENINSLKGHWEIDFTDERYKKNHNQFVICGPTGAGKTTILDGITLGLFGETPRESISQENNEVMCKGTASCMAAVTYECAKGKFRSEFKQNRADKKIDGKLQAPKCKVTNLDTDVDILTAGSIKALKNMTAKIINLDYDQFCRSMLLAQGSFGAFLKGTEREKAAILAKLNGTQDYKTAAKRLWEKSRDKIAECNEKIGEADKIILLTDAEKAEYETALDNCQKEIGKIDVETADLQAKIQWVEELAAKEKTYSLAIENKETALAGETAFAEKENKLNLAEKASNCALEYNDYQKYNSDSVLLKDKLTTDEKDSEDKDKKHNEALAKQLESERYYNEVKAKDESALWGEVSDLDKDIQAAEERLAEQNNQKKKAEDDYAEAEKKSKELETKNAKCKSDLDLIEKYLKDNDIDKELEVKLIELNSCKDSIVNLCEKIAESSEEKASNENELALEKANLEKIIKDIAEYESELQEFVSNNYKSISKALRASCLSEGKACPVCGSVNHPFCDEDKANGLSERNSSENVNDGVAAKALQLSENIDNKNTEKNTCEQNIIRIQANLDTILTNIEGNKKSLSASINTFDDSVAAWKLKLNQDSVKESSTECLEKLTGLCNVYQEKVRERDRITNEIDNNSKILGAINLTKLKENYDSENAKNAELVAKSDSLKTKRKTLFGDKVVAMEKAKYEKELGNAEMVKEEATKAVNDASIARERAKAAVESIKEQIAVNTRNLEIARNCLNAALNKNGFASVEELSECMISAEELEKLRKEKSEIKEFVIKSKTAFETAEKAYKEHKAKELTTESREMLAANKSSLDSRKAELNQEIGRITESLETDKKKSEEKQQLFKNNANLEKEKKMYTNIQKIIGVKDGDDVEVFVQKLALDNLIITANSYLEQILPDYTLKSKENSLECILHDINHPDDDRPVSNLSGGEAFSVSLSLALALAEVASYRVQVDSLFLDEGFGTLSGEPLEQAINSLKRLQSTGKMLGIITHVEPVIDAFDLKIEASKSHGISKLNGPGISMIKTNLDDKKTKKSKKTKADD